MQRCQNIADLARFIGLRCTLRNPIVLAGIVELLPAINGTRMVMVEREGYRRPVMYLPDTDPVIDGGVWITGMGDGSGRLYVLTPNYQVPWVASYVSAPLSA